MSGVQAGRALAGERDLLATAARLAGADLVDAQLRSIHERPGRGRSVLYDTTLRMNGREESSVLVTHTDRRGFPDGALVLEHGGQQVAVWRYPHDPYLPGLASATSPGRLRELLDALDGPPGEVSVRARAYRPTRRGVLEVTVHGPRQGRILYLKVFAPHRAAGVARRHRTLATAGLPVPRLVGFAAAQGIVALEALAGRTLSEAVRAGAPLPDPADLVELSQRFATSGVAGSRDPRRFADPERHVPLLSSVVPEHAERIATLAAQAAAVEGPLVGVHGDLHAAQLLLGPDGSVQGVLDVDGSGQGHLAHDAGNLVAHLEAFGDLTPGVTARAHAYAASVGDAYAEVVGREQLARATAASWIGLATGAHRAQEPGWEAELLRRIDRAEACLSY